MRKFFTDVEAGLAPLWRAAEEASTDEAGDKEDIGRFVLGPEVVPDDGDYRLGYDLLRVSEGILCVHGQGKHASATFETDDLWFEMPDRPEPGPALPPQEVWYCWKELAVPGGTEAPPETTPRLLTPHADPDVYEQEIDYIWATPEAAIFYRDEQYREFDDEADRDDAAGWVLCRMTLTPVPCPPSPGLSSR